MTVAGNVPERWLVAGLPTVATLAGGAAALRFRSALNLFLGFGSGAVIGVALFDLLPEALELSRSFYPPITITTALAIGFVLYLSLDRLSLPTTNGLGAYRSHLGPLSLTIHSLMDGLSIGLAFRASPSVGMIVAFAVIAHDLLDGANTVTLSLTAGAGTRGAKRWLIVNAVAPLFGMGIAQFIAVPPAVLSVALSIFAGFFLYIGAGELLPRSYVVRPRPSTLAATIVGMLFMYVIVKAADF